jgi:hypothetical protein
MEAMGSPTRPKSLENLTLPLIHDKGVSHEKMKGLVHDKRLKQAQLCMCDMKAERQAAARRNARLLRLADMPVEIKGWPRDEGPPSCYGKKPVEKPLGRKRPHYLDYPVPTELPPIDVKSLDELKEIMSRKFNEEPPVKARGSLFQKPRESTFSKPRESLFSKLRESLFSKPRESLFSEPSPDKLASRRETLVMDQPAQATDQVVDSKGDGIVTAKLKDQIGGVQMSGMGEELDLLRDQMLSQIEEKANQEAESLFWRAMRAPFTHVAQASTVQQPSTIEKKKKVKIGKKSFKGQQSNEAPTGKKTARKAQRDTRRTRKKVDAQRALKETKSKDIVGTQSRELGEPERVSVKLLDCVKPLSIPITTPHFMLRDLINMTHEAIWNKMEGIFNEYFERSKTSPNSLPRVGEASHFPGGFGFYLCPEADYRRDEEPYLGSVYDAIRSLNDPETEDKLMCFLDDFRMRQAILTSTTKQSSELCHNIILHYDTLSDRVQDVEGDACYMDGLHHSDHYLEIAYEEYQKIRRLISLRKFISFRRMLHFTLKKEDKKMQAQAQPDKEHEDKKPKRKKTQKAKKGGPAQPGSDHMVTDLRDANTLEGTMMREMWEALEDAMTDKNKLSIDLIRITINCLAIAIKAQVKIITVKKMRRIKYQNNIRDLCQKDAPLKNQFMKAVFNKIAIEREEEEAEKLSPKLQQCIREVVPRKHRGAQSDFLELLRMEPIGQVLLQPGCADTSQEELNVIVTSTVKSTAEDASELPRFVARSRSQPDQPQQQQQQQQQPQPPEPEPDKGTTEDQSPEPATRQSTMEEDDKRPRSPRSRGLSLGGSLETDEENEKRRRRSRDQSLTTSLAISLSGLRRSSTGRRASRLSTSSLGLEHPQGAMLGEDAVSRRSSASSLQSIGYGGLTVEEIEQLSRHRKSSGLLDNVVPQQQVPWWCRVQEELDDDDDDDEMGLRRKLKIRSEPELEEETEEDLHYMAQTFAERGIQHLLELEKVLESLKRKATSELGDIAEKQTRVVDLMDSIYSVVSKLSEHTTSLPIIKMRSDSVKVMVEREPQHTCRMCSCHAHPSQGEEVTLDTWKTANALGHTLDHCKKYETMLETVRLRYHDILRTLDSAFTMLASGLQTLHWTEGYQGYVADYSSMDDAVRKRLKVALYVLEQMTTRDVPEFLLKAKSVSEHVNRLTMGVVRLLCDVNTRLQDMQQQGQLLNDIMAELGNAEQHVLNTAYEVSAGPFQHHHRVQTLYLIVILEQHVLNTAYEVGAGPFQHHHRVQTLYLIVILEQLVVSIAFEVTLYLTLFWLPDCGLSNHTDGQTL